LLTEKLKTEIRENGVRKTARTARVSPNTVSRFVLGKSTLQLDTVDLILEALGLDTKIVKKGKK